MDKIGLLRDLFDQKIIDVLKFFLSNKGKDFYLKEIADNVHVPIATTHRIIKKLVRLNVLMEKNISKFKIYTISDTENVEYLTTFIKEPPKIEKFIEDIKNVPGIKRIILHGKESDTMANVLIIGDNIDKTRIMDIVINIKKQSNFNIVHMNLTEEQYDQMTTMALFPGIKKVLYDVQVTK
jgi:hypothetical protein